MDNAELPNISIVYLYFTIIFSTYLNDIVLKLSLSRKTFPIIEFSS